MPELFSYKPVQVKDLCLVNMIKKEGKKSIG